MTTWWFVPLSTDDVVSKMFQTQYISRGGRRGIVVDVIFMAENRGMEFLEFDSRQIV
jgi:hypothetical protein